MVGTLGRNVGCRMCSWDRRRGSRGRNAVWSLRSNRSGCGRSREGRGGSGRGHVVWPLWGEGWSRVASTDKRQKHPAREPQRVSLQDDGPQKTGAQGAAAEPGTTLCDVPNAEEALEAGRPGRGLTYARWRQVGAPGGFPVTRGSRRRGVSRRGRIEFVGKARKLPDVGKIPGAPPNAPIANGLLGVFMLVVMILTHLDIFDHSGGIFGENRQRAIE